MSRRILTVARRELKGYFDQPTAYVLIVAFLAISLFLAFRTMYAIGSASLRPIMTSSESSATVRYGASCSASVDAPAPALASGSEPSPTGSTPLPPATTPVTRCIPMCDTGHAE